MASTLYLIDGPVMPVLTVAEALAHLRIDANDADEVALIGGLVDAITQNFDGRDGWLGRALISQTWEMRMDDFAGGRGSRHWGSRPWGSHISDHHSWWEIRIPLPPLIEVVSIQYYDIDDALQTLSTDIYEVVGVSAQSPGRICLRYNQIWPTTNIRREAVIVRFRAGYVDTDPSPQNGVVPQPIKQAMLLLIGTLYNNRESVAVGVSVNELPDVVQMLIGPYVVPYFGEGRHF